MSHLWTCLRAGNSPLLVRIFVVILALILLGPGAFGQKTAAGEDRFARERQAMVADQIEARGVRDPRVLAAMRTVPRHLFVPDEFRARSYEDHPLPIGEGQTISQPYIVALMTEALALKATDRVLEIGTGSGYQAAVLSRLARRVLSVEIDGVLARRAADTLSRLGYANVTVRRGDGFFGWQEEAPFDAVIVTCAVEAVPPALLDQLAEGGRLIAPVGNTQLFQTLTLIRKTAGRPVVQRLIDVRFVPMTGAAQESRRR